MIEFSRAIGSSGLTPPQEIEPGKFHRFPGIGKRNGNTAGWCKLFPDGQGGVYGDYSIGLSESWQVEREQPITKEERAAFLRQVEESRLQAEDQRQQELQAAAVRAKEILAGATGDPAGHRYARIKKVSLGSLVRRGAWEQNGWADALLAPMYDEHGQVVSVQAIDTGGSKRFLAGGQKKGCFHPLGKFRGTKGRVLIGEGLATVAAAVSATGLPGVVAFDAGNLLPVAEVVRKLAPDAEIIFLADNDFEEGTDQNPGVEAVSRAVSVVGGLVAIPDLGGRKCDWWDVWSEQGPEAVRTAIEKAADWSKNESTPFAREERQGRPHCEPAPLPLPELPAVEPFMPELLPDNLAPWVKDIAERMQCPMDFVAVGAMVNLAAVIGRKVGIRPKDKDNWTEVPNLWGLIVARPGELKTPALEATSGPLKKLEAEALVRFDQDARMAAAASVAAKLRFEAQEKEARKLLIEDVSADVMDLLIKEEINEPVLRRYKTNDTTAASLGELMRQNPNGLLVFRDEIVSLLRVLDREDNADQRGLFLEAWGGNSSYTLDRIGRGLHLHIEACCVSLLGGTQPAKLAGYINQALAGGPTDDGLIQRFGLLVWPDTKAEWKNIDRYPDTQAKNRAYEVFDRLDKLNPSDIGAEQDTDFDGNPAGIPYLRFNQPALVLFNEWRAELEKKLRAEELHPALESHFAKYRKLVPALALIIHLADGGTGPVSEGATLKALAWAEYLGSHAKRCYSAVTQKDVQAAKAIKRRIKKGDLATPFSIRDVWRPGWAGLDRDAAIGGISLLVDYGHLSTEVLADTGGRPATRYHPAEAAG